MNKLFAIAVLLLLGIFLFGCTQAPPQTAPTTGQQTQKMHPSQEATASEQPTASASSAEFQVPSGGVDPKDFCGNNQASKEFIEFIYSAAANAGFSVERNTLNVGLQPAYMHSVSCRFSLFDQYNISKIAVGLAFYDYIDRLPRQCEQPPSSQIKVTALSEIPNSCLYVQDVFDTIYFTKKNVFANISPSPADLSSGPHDKKRIDNAKIFAKAIYDKI